MSGHKVVAVLDAFREGYVYGNTVYRRKQTVLNSSKRANYTISSSAASAGAASQQQGPSTTVIDLVLSHRGAFKLKSKVTPPKVPSATANKDKEAAAAKKKKFSQRGVAAAASPSSHADPNNANDDDDSDFDPLDADAMMQAAANGEDIQRLYGQLRAKREARQRAKAEAGGGSSSSSSSAANNSSKPEVIWRQEHCFVRAITPLLALEEEHAEEQYRRSEEEEEEQRLREEEEEAKAVLEHALKGSAEGRMGASSVRKRTNNKYENADEAANSSAANKLTPAMSKRRNLTPSELACDRSVADTQLYGFTVHYFAIGKAPKSPQEETAEGSKYSQFVKNALGGSSSSSASSVPTIRHRTYVCGSQYEQQEWLMVYRNTLLNYWHERLETSVIMAPEIFQFQTFAMNVGGSGSGFMGGASSFPVGGVVHAVLSTTALYVLPRSNKAEFESDDTMRYIRMPLDALQRVVVGRSRGTVSIAGGPFVAGKSALNIAFFSPLECTEFVVELQRVWEMSAPAAAAADGSFPYELSA